MFLHSSHLPQVLPAECYSAEDQYASELKRLFLPGWHCVGSLSDLPRVGDYVTIDLFGHPLLLYRTQESVRCFLNVCAHRFALLTSQRCGHMPTLRCQYHGWEYDENGCTRRIPDARSFRPMRDGQLGLQEQCVQCWGQLIFVNLAAEPCRLQDFLGAGCDRCEDWFSPDRERIMRRELDAGVNWKVKIENTLESYHIDCVHKRSFGRSPAAENCTHVLDDAGSMFSTDEPPASGAQRIVDSFIHELIGVPRDRVYEHFIVHPNFMIGKAGIFTWVETVVPLSATRCRVVVTMFCRRGNRRNPVSRLARRAIISLGRRFASIALDEDMAIVTDVQRGLEAPTQPSGGLISIREERIFHFQQFIERTTRQDVK